MATTIAPGVLGAEQTRIEGREKVTGRAVYAYEYEVEGTVYAWLVQATIARGTVRAVDGSEARRRDGVLAVISHENAPKLGEPDERELRVLQSPRVHYRGQIVAIAVAETLEGAREAADLVRVEYDAEAHDVALRDDHPKLYTPEKVNPNFPSDTDEGDVEAALAASSRARRRDVHDAGRAQQPDGAARVASRSGAAATSRSTTRPRARPALGTRSRARSGSTPSACA